jgi:hypothetical protein
LIQNDFLHKPSILLMGSRLCSKMGSRAGFRMLETGLFSWKRA